MATKRIPDLSAAQRKDICDIHYGMIEVVLSEFLSRPAFRKYKPYRAYLKSEATVILVKCSKNFNPYYGVLFKSYASKCIRRHFLKVLAKIDKKNRMEQSLDALIETSFEPGCIDQNLERLLNDEKEEEDRPISLEDVYITDNELEKKIIQECFVGGKSPKDFCNETGESYWKIHHRIRKLRKILREKGVNPEYMYSFLKWTDKLNIKEKTE